MPNIPLRSSPAQRSKARTTANYRFKNVPTAGGNSTFALCVDIEYARDLSATDYQHNHQYSSPPRLSQQVTQRQRQADKTQNNRHTCFPQSLSTTSLRPPSRPGTSSISTSAISLSTLPENVTRTSRGSAGKGTSQLRYTCSTPLFKRSCRGLGPPQVGRTGDSEMGL